MFLWCIRSTKFHCSQMSPWHHSPGVLPPCVHHWPTVWLIFPQKHPTSFAVNQLANWFNWKYEITCMSQNSSNLYLQLQIDKLTMTTCVFIVPCFESEWMVFLCHIDFQRDAANNNVFVGSSVSKGSIVILRLCCRAVLSQCQGCTVFFHPLKCFFPQSSCRTKEWTFECKKIFSFYF